MKEEEKQQSSRPAGPVCGVADVLGAEQAPRHWAALGPAGKARWEGTEE